jgi:hypothetical protein
MPRMILRRNRRTFHRRGGRGYPWSHRRRIDLAHLLPSPSSSGLRNASSSNVSAGPPRQNAGWLSGPRPSSWPLTAGAMWPSPPISAGTGPGCRSGAGTSLRTGWRGSGIDRAAAVRRDFPPATRADRRAGLRHASGPRVGRDVEPGAAGLARAGAAASQAGDRGGAPAVLGVRCGTVEPEAPEQRCWKGAPAKSRRTSWGTLEILNVVDELPKTQQRTARRMRRDVMEVPTQTEAERKRRELKTRAQSLGYRQAAETLGRSWGPDGDLLRVPPGA